QADRRACREAAGGGGRVAIHKTVPDRAVPAKCDWAATTDRKRAAGAHYAGSVTNLSNPVGWRALNLASGHIHNSTIYQRPKVGGESGSPIRAASSLRVASRRCKWPKFICTQMFQHGFAAAGKVIARRD